MTEQALEALAAFRTALAGNAAALAHFAHVVPELERRIAAPQDQPDLAATLVWDWFNTHFPGSPASCDEELWRALHDTAIPALIEALSH
jgi:hypothetical protein